MLRHLVLGSLLIVFALQLYTWASVRWIEHRFPPLGAFVTVRGLRLHYVMQGNGPGPTLLLIHGASSNLREFSSNLLPRLAQQHRVIAFDRPGYGYSDRGDGPWMTPADIASLLLDACAQLGIERPVLVGHSWAGSVVMAALVEHPERVAGGVLLGGVTGHWAGSAGWTYDVGALPLIGPLFAWTLVMPAGQLLLPREVVPVVAPDPVPPQYIDNIGAPLALRPRSFLDNVEDMMRLNEYLQTLSVRYDQIHAPLLLIHGDHDALVPFWNHGRRVLPVVPQAQVLLLRNAGHALHHTHLREVAGAIDRFVAKLPAAADTNPATTLPRIAAYGH